MPRKFASVPAFPCLPLLRASILDFRPRLGNRCKVFPVYALLRASILDFKLRLANRCKGRMVSPAAVVAATSSASDSNFLSCKEEWPACSDRSGDDLPRPNLIFVAAKKNGSACSSSTKTAKIEVEIGQVLQ